MKRQRQNRVKLNLEIPVRDREGKKVDTIALSDKVFDGRVNMPLIHQAVTMYNANRRLGTASSKTRGEVRGGGKKPWRQKGTGRARTGSIRNPLWKGGGVIFGPHPRDFSYTMPKKQRRGALLSAMNAKLIDNGLMIIEELKLERPKTKEVRKFLESMGIRVKEEGTLVILDKVDENLILASRNIPKLTLRAGGNFNADDILRHHKVIIQKSVMKTLMKGCLINE